MKNFLFVVLLCVVAACTDKHANEATIHVKVDQMTYSKVILVFNATEIQADLDAEGRATITAPVTDYAYAQLYYGEEAKLLFLENGDDVKVAFDARKFKDGIQFEGKNAPVVDFLNAVNYSTEGIDNYGLPLDEYLKVMEARTSDALELLKARRLETVNPAFVTLEESRIKYMFAMSLIMYPMGHPYLTQDTTYQPGEDYYQVLEGFVKEDEKLVNVPTYRDFIYEAAVQLQRRDGDSGRGYYSKLLSQVRYIGGKFTDEKVKQSLIVIAAIPYLQAMGNKDTDELKELCNQYVTDPGLKADLQEAFGK